MAFSVGCLRNVRRVLFYCLQDEISARNKAFTDMETAGQKMIDDKHYASEQVTEKVNQVLLLASLCSSTKIEENPIFQC